MKSHPYAQTLIIGGGVTGAGVARDLSLRGVQCLVIEKADINAGASGSNHGLLHSGARYVSADPQTAEQCSAENRLLKRLMPCCIEETGGLFVAFQGDDERYVADFPHMCTRSGVPFKELDPKEALEMEPALSDRLIAAYQVEDATIDPFKVSMANLRQALDHGAAFLPYTRAVAFEKKKGRVDAVRILNLKTGKTGSVKVEQVVNCAGAWSGEIAKLAGITIDLTLSKGSLIVTQRRITGHVINRLRSPSDGDILVPGGTVSLLGTTSIRLNSPNRIAATVEEVDRIIDECTCMVPRLETTRYTRAFAGVRPLMQDSGKEDDRNAGRGFWLRDHSAEGTENFTTITGGKLTTFRLMAEKTADLICRKLGIQKACRTRLEPLPVQEGERWTTPGVSARHWLKSHDPEDLLVCECEMVPESVVRQIASNQIGGGKDPIRITEISARSRLGKGACQGTFCGIRAAAFLTGKSEGGNPQGVHAIREFYSERWKGQRPVLWNGQLVQSELAEAIHCGLLGMEL